ncbi:MAG: hypothetical protein RL095_224 [Verrucomicrobiota bacterium]
MRITVKDLCPSCHSRYGSPMGRGKAGAEDLIEHLDACSPEEARIRYLRIPLNAGGYDPGGAYWGLGSPLYCLHVAGLPVLWKRMAGMPDLSRNARRSIAEHHGQAAALDLLDEAFPREPWTFARGMLAKQESKLVPLHTYLAWLRQGGDESSTQKSEK